MNLLVLVLPLFWGESFSQEHPGFDIRVQETVTVQEGLCVSIHCTFQYPEVHNSNNPFGYWFKGTEEKTPVATNDLRRTRGDTPNILWTGSALSSQAFLSHDLNSSQLLFTPKAQDHGTNLTCQVTFQEPRVSTETTVQLRVAGRPRILGPSCSWTEEGSLCTCSVQGDLDPPSLLWWVGENIVHGNSSDNTLHVVHSTSRTWTNSSLILAKRLGTGLSISCEGKNYHGTHSASVLLLVPVFSTQEKSSWPLVLTLLRGALMGAGFLLTYGLTWAYYTR
ncbi:sialic acid-binding Ig-like lectin 14 [Notamacropus eugenii]|uniref:sialic acid-binding Ig-like lectin 14 n=1 Tax=Notamacropus eugenii TaxID=9315 RepID=UPI003B670D34